MSIGFRHSDQSTRVETFRGSLALLGLILWVVFLVPPVTVLANRYETVQAIQFMMFAAVVPALFSTGAPWRRLHLASGERHEIGLDGQRISPQRPLLIDRWAIAHASQRGDRRAVGLVLLFVGLVVFWRSAPVVNAIEHHFLFTVVESLTIVIAGSLMWLDLVESPPFTPGTTRPFRIGMTAAAMWTLWVVAYLEAMSHDSWYSAFHHVAGQGISLSADQQLTAGAMWFLSAVAFLPLIFWNLIHWLESEEDPNDELYRLVRQERTRGFFGTSK